MAKTTDAGSTDWAKMTQLSEEERIAEMSERFIAIHSLSPDKRVTELETFIRGMDSLPGADMAELSKSKLKAWLSMDKSMAKQAAEEFQEAMDTMPGNIAMKHATMDQTVSLHFSHDEVTLLAEMDPKVFRSMPGVAKTTAAEDIETVPSEADPWWKFW